jgi:O-antigen/teichoic acid export membrane protein
MLRRLLVDSSVYTVAAAIPGLAGVVLLPVYTRYLSAEEYGLVDLVTLTYTVVTVVATLEVSQGLARHLPEAKEVEARRRLSSTAFWFTGATMLSAVILVLLAAPWVAPLVLQKTNAVGLLKIGGLTAVVGAVYGVALRQLRWTFRPHAFLAVTAITSIATAAATLFCLWQYDQGPAALLLGQTVGSAVGLALAWRLARDGLALTWDRTAARQMLTFSSPLVASTLGFLAAGQASRWIIAHVGSLEAAGHFGVGTRVASILGFAASGLQLSLAPLIYRAHRDAKTPDDIAISFRHFVAAALLLWAGLTLFAPEILRAVAAPEFQAAAPLIAPLGAAVVINTAMIFAPGLEIRHRTRWVAAVGVCGGALHMPLSWIAVEHFGAMGAATAMCVIAILQMSLIFGMSQKCYPVPHRWRTLLGAIAIAIFSTQVVRFVPGILARVAALAAVGIACWVLLLQLPPFRNKAVA